LLALDQYYLFSGSDDSTVKVWETHNNMLLYTLQGHTSQINELLILEETGILITIGNDKKIIFWNYKEQKEVKSLEKNETIRSADYLYGSKMMILGTQEAKIITLNISEFLDIDKYRPNSEGKKLQEEKVEFKEGEDEDNSEILADREMHDDEKIKELFSSKQFLTKI